VGELVQNKLDDGKWGCAEPLFQGVGWVVCHNGHPIWKERRAIGIE
jgi:hypothetical protein